MKTFKDLVFKTHGMGKEYGIQARTILADGTEISVIQGKHFYNGIGSYEMMSCRVKQNSGVRGWLTPKQITAHMIYVQKNPKKATT